MNKLLFSFIVFFIISASYAYYTENIPNHCESAYSKLYAVFTINQYNCSEGYFLPSDTFGCESCPTDFSCPGGTYAFNENEYQGVLRKSNYITHSLTNMCAQNAPHRLTATFTPNEHTCPAGQYLPANIDGCRTCPANSYCAGGTYSFNETTDQGITSCPNSHPVSVAGSSSINQCQKTINWYNENSLSSTSTCNYNGLITIPSTEPTRPGYRFVGWKLEINK